MSPANDRVVCDSCQAASPAAKSGAEAVRLWNRAELRRQLSDERTISDHLAASLMGEYSKMDALDAYKSSLADPLRVGRFIKENAQPSCGATESQPNP
jgi:hypothetical protein